MFDPSSTPDDGAQLRDDRRRPAPAPDTMRPIGRGGRAPRFWIYDDARLDACGFTIGARYRLDHVRPEGFDLIPDPEGKRRVLSKTERGRTYGLIDIQSARDLACFGDATAVRVWFDTANRRIRVQRA